jgi:hypothetical protein
MVKSIRSPTELSRLMINSSFVERPMVNKNKPGNSLRMTKLKVENLKGVFAAQGSFDSANLLREKHKDSVLKENFKNMSIQF